MGSRRALKAPIVSVSGQKDPDWQVSGAITLTSDGPATRSYGK